MVTGLAFSILYETWDANGALRRNADDISAVLETGERWRGDVRTASGGLKAELSASSSEWTIPQRNGLVRYRFAEGEIRRKRDGEITWTTLLRRVKSSRMEIDERRRVSGWRWELELEAERRSAKILPLFDFEAVPGKTN